MAGLLPGKLGGFKKSQVPKEWKGYLSKLSKNDLEALTEFSSSLYYKAWANLVEIIRQNEFESFMENRSRDLEQLGLKQVEVKAKLKMIPFLLHISDIAKDVKPPS